jgi:hypothetical protein
MGKEKNTDIIKRVIKIAVVFQIIMIIFSFLFTMNIIYSIIVFLAGTIGISSFLIMIKLTDKCLFKGKGNILFFLMTFLKMAIITIIFYFISKISEKATLFFLLGLSVIVISIMIEGAYQFYRSFSNDRT